VAIPPSLRAVTNDDAVTDADADADTEGPWAMRSIGFTGWHWRCYTETPKSLNAAFNVTFLSVLALRLPMISATGI
jgi:hypothetical protein